MKETRNFVRQRKFITLTVMKWIYYYTDKKEETGYTVFILCFINFGLKEILFTTVSGKEKKWKDNPNEKGLSVFFRK